MLDCVPWLLLAAIIGIVSEDAAAAAPVMGILVSLAFVVIFTKLELREPLPHVVLSPLLVESSGFNYSSLSLEVSFQ